MSARYWSGFAFSLHAFINVKMDHMCGLINNANRKLNTNLDLGSVFNTKSNEVVFSKSSEQGTMVFMFFPKTRSSC